MSTKFAAPSNLEGTPGALSRIGRSRRARLLGAGILALMASPTLASLDEGTLRPTSNPEGGRLPSTPSSGRDRLAFESNRGQLDETVRFAARGNGFALRLTDRGATLGLHDAEGNVVVGLDIAGLPGAVPVATEPLRARSHYFEGRAESSWRRDVPRFARVTYPGVRPGVDLVFHGEEGRLEYDFIVAPGASPDDATLEITGAEKLSLDANGDLLIHTRDRVLRQPPPTVYQEGAGGDRVRVPASYRLSGDTRLAFAVGRYDTTEALVIDPVLLYSSYLGGSSFDQATAVAVDASGNVYVTGLTTSPDFPSKSAVQPASGGSTDVFVAKLDPSGRELLYATYLGGSSEDMAYGIAVDASGAAYVTGTTSSADFPVFPAPTSTKSHGGACPTFQCSNHGASNAFVAKLAPDGSALAYSTFLGGTGYDAAQGITVDAQGDVHVAGFTQSTDFPTVSPYQSALKGTQNAFVAELSPDGAKLLASTYLGGSGNDAAAALAVDAQGDAYVTGYTQSPDFPAHGMQQTLRGVQNAFVVELTPSLKKLALSTYLGGSGNDAANAIAVDASGDVIVAGGTTSTDFPIQKGAYRSSNTGNQDAFVTRLGEDGGALVYSTYLGGSRNDFAAGLALDDAGTAYVVGETRSTDFPIRSGFGATNLAAAQGGSAFIALLDATGHTLLGSGGLGGAGGASALAVALGPANTAWIAGAAGAGLATKDALFRAIQTLAPNGRNAFLAEVSADAGTEDNDDAAAEPGDGGTDAGEETADDAGPGSSSSSGVTVVPASDDEPETAGSSGCSCRQSRAAHANDAAWGCAFVAGALLRRRRRTSPVNAG